MIDKNISILGSGTMGHSIALTAALAGFSIKVWGNDQHDIERGSKELHRKLGILVAEEVIDESKSKEITERIQFTLSIGKCIQDASFIIEAVPEILDLKQRLYEQLDQRCSMDVILASNTSGLSPTAIASRMKHPERMIVTHFWNPAHLIPLVEVVRGEKTADKTVKKALSLLSAMNKKPIEVKKDILGSIGNRLQYALFREAQHILEIGAATVEEIDAAVRYSIGRRLTVTGPFMTADMGGLDVFHHISDYLFKDLSIAPTSLSTMKTLVAEGKYGQKNGAGFYQWSPEFSEKMNAEREKELIKWLKMDLMI
ncbi:3-hydroxyacyl-CoA dehydrogenase family protein [Heyndrickxia ginsengihumi]|uniref:3-hydroxyacyl-CoA dehydrogenase family protein n=1 Tax=Heyndrickxia ginsengihumi TaxID=363870 RepID=UPI0004BCB3D9|nr:3-hydroxyacyl-CoA dehydrogenase NAD-binding domain-containing protein [Heyndrickxia ginsengihumi]